MTESLLTIKYNVCYLLTGLRRSSVLALELSFQLPHQLFLQQPQNLRNVYGPE
jgi:hypothetical protein